MADGERWAALILAAGKSVRMHSSLPKVLHPLCGQPLITFPIQAARQAGIDRLAIVVGHGAPQVKAALGQLLEYIHQEEPLGSGHAVRQVQGHLEGQVDHLLVLYGDVPLLQPETVRRLMQRHRASEAVLTFLTALDCPGDGLGRVLRDGQGKPTAIIEHTDATPEIKALREINAGAYCFQAQWLWPRLAQLQPSNSGEYYLVDLVSLAARAGDLVETETCEDPREALGVNTRVQLAQAEAILRQRIRERWMLQGVTILDPASTFIDMEVEIGQDTVLHPNTMLYGKSRIGSRCVLGPNTIIRESVVGPGCTVLASVVERSVLEEGVDIGPFSHLREESYIENGVHLGNFVEVKKSRLGKGAKSGHFSYLGDATIGANVNIGAGTVTCNYDGVNKNPTFIEEDAFIGCDTMLVAPVKVGKGAITGAGSVVTKDVPPGEVVVGVPAKPMPRSKGRPGKGKSASSRS